MKTISEKFDERFKIHTRYNGRHTENQARLYGKIHIEPQEMLVEIKSFILSEMTALMKECVGEGIQPADGHASRFNYPAEYYAGYNEKRQEVKEIAAKHGIKI